MYMASTPDCSVAERTVTLLAFEDASQSPLADLMDVTQRQKTASELNAAILSSQCQVRSLTHSSRLLCSQAFFVFELSAPGLVPGKALALIAKDWCLQCLRLPVTYRKRSHACLHCSSCLCGHRTSWTQGAHIHGSMTWRLQLSQIQCRPSRKVSDLLNSLPLCCSNAAINAEMPFYTIF